MSNKPTVDTYDAILQAYDFFNQALFDDQLPTVIVTHHRQRRIMGYASIARWINSNQDFVDELAVNPEYFAKYPLVEICQTLCHEMTHIWQAHFGKPGRRGYHNKQWAKKMIHIGLMPSSTSKPGGDMTGEAMMDYMLLDGPFLKSCRELVRQGYHIPWIDRYPVFRHDVPILAFTESGDAVELDKHFEAKKTIKTSQNAQRTDREAAPSSHLKIMDMDATKRFELNDEYSDSERYPEFTTKPPTKAGRVKYSCKSCNINVWGKPSLKIGCLNCNIQMHEST